LTERRKTEAEISHLASFPELNPNPIIELDTIGNVKYANPAARMRFSDLMVLGVKHPFLIGLITIIQEGNTHLVSRDVHIDDTWYEQVLSYVPSTQSYRLYSMEITERKQAVEELKMSEESLKRAQTLGRIGSWAFDVANQTITWSEETYVLYERDPKIGPPSP
jgi:PAS domain-containing protein